MATEYISRDAAIDAVDVCNLHRGIIDALQAIISDIPAADVRPVPDGGIGEMSDGYHTFNGLYYQRMVLFAALVKAHKGKAWKSRKHEDGEICFGGGWFIVGIDTPEGSYTYHYENKDFELFDCEELPVGKHWDGHTEADVTRLLSLPAADVVEVVRYKPTPPKEWSEDTYYEIIEAVDSRLLDELDKVKPDGTHGSILSPGLMVASGIIQELHLRRTKRD